jgi:hypothetical protein
MLVLLDLFALKRSLQAGRPRSQLRATRFVDGACYGISYQVANAPCTDWSADALVADKHGTLAVQWH